MLRRWSVLLVTILGLASIWGLTQFSGSNTNPKTLASAPAASAIAASPSSTEVITPDLSRLDAKVFLDPVPVGHKAPDFQLTDATTGKPFKLSSLRGKSNVVMVFYQGSFCPVCGHQLENLQRHLSDFKKQDAVIVAVSADDLANAQKSVGEHGLSFHVLPDPRKDIIQKFGVANVSKHGIAWPSSFVIDKQGIVRLSVADPEGKRLHSDSFLPALSKLTGKPAPQLSYEQ